MFVPVRSGGLVVVLQRHAGNVRATVARGAAMEMARRSMVVVEAVVSMVVVLEPLGEQSLAVVVHVRAVAIVMLVLVQRRAGQRDGRREHRRGQQAEAGESGAHASHR